MTIYEYITKNLTNLNWNILPQIFEDNEVELTEDIKKYLKETPGNTNWNILKGMVENREIIFFEGEIVATQRSPNGWGTDDFSSLVLEDAINNGDIIIVTLADGTKLEFIAKIEAGEPYIVIPNINLPNEKRYSFTDERYNNSQYSSHSIFINGINTGAFTVVKIIIKKA